MSLLSSPILSLLRPALIRSVLLAGALFACAAQAAIYRCVTPSGVIEYSNTTPSPERARQCEKLDLPQITTIPAAPVPAAKAAPREDSGSRDSDGRGPSVSSATQNKRDAERLQILRDEYRREAARLNDLRGEYRDGQPERLGSERNYQKYLDRVERLKSDIARTSANLNALKTEIRALED
ncbi:MAG: DUF4124 domain-containing protein [Burkholderiaceae bacterium]